ncbi:hypothetical protein ACHAQA_008444 [Verticillium albo-atrum]
MFSANLAYRPASAIASEQPRHINPTPANRMSTILALAEKREWESQRINLDALIRYYKQGNRCPIGEEELWAINGELSWGIRRSARDFDQDLFFDQSVPILCERLNASKLIFEENGASHWTYFNWDRHPVLVARSEQLDYEQRLRKCLEGVALRIRNLENQRLQMEHLLARCREDDFQRHKESKSKRMTSPDGQRTRKRLRL